LFKVRLISAAVGLALLAVVILLPKEVLGIAVFIFALIGIREFYSAASKAGYKPVKVLGYLTCLVLVILAFNDYKGAASFSLIPSNPMHSFSFIVFLVLFILCSLIVFLHERYSINDISLTFFGIFYVTFLFSFITLTRNLENGKYFILLIFIGAWMTDTFAYFAGKAAGKRKLIPSVSPKKTVEGSIGGVIGCVAAAAVYGIFINKIVNYIPVYHYIIIGTLSGIISQIGDLSASAIKRYAGIKDYSSIMPGHGGVLDRFDSVLFVAPVVYFYISFLQHYQV